MTSRRFKRERKRSRPPTGVPCEAPRLWFEGDPPEWVPLKSQTEFQTVPFNEVMKRLFPLPPMPPNRFKQAFAVEMDRVRYFMGPTTEDMPTLKRLRWEFAEAGAELESPINIGVN